MQNDAFLAIVGKIDEYAREKKYMSICSLLEKIGRKAFPKDRKWFYDEILGNIYALLGDVSQSVIHYRNLALSSSKNPIHLRCGAYSTMLMQLHYLSMSDAELNFWHHKYDQMYGEISKFIIDKEIHKKHDKIHIGYMSTDFWGHIVTNFSIQLFAHYNRHRYELHIYQVTMESDEVTEQLRGLVDFWHDCGNLEPHTIAERIYLNEIDILFDLSGHTRGGRTLQIAAYHPAPIQVCGIGWFDTTGLSSIDYFLTDKYLYTAENRKDFQEKMIIMNNSHFCYTPSEAVLEIPDKHRIHDGIVFGCFNNFAKITDEMLNVWLQIIHHVPNSKLFLKNVSEDENLVKKMRSRAICLGFKPEQLEIQTAERQYLGRYLDVDIALDTYPYPGGGTTCEALYMGVPVISRYGRRHGSRFGLSILSNVGCGGLAVPNNQEYIRVAVELARNKKKLSYLHENLRHLMCESSLMQATEYVREIETKYEAIWQDFIEK